MTCTKITGLWINAGKNADIFVKQGSHVPVSCFIYALVNGPYCLYFWHQNVKNRIIQTVVYELHQAVVTPRQLAWLILIAI